MFHFIHQIAALSVRRAGRVQFVLGAFSLPAEAENNIDEVG